MTALTCFKAYDIRGRLGEELNADIAYRIGRATGQFLQAKTVVVGGDVRSTSEALKQALSTGLMDAGVDVIDLGMTGTEEIYFATYHLGVDGGIEVTASHNPNDYNGMKLVKAGSRPISGDNGLFDIRRIAETDDFAEPSARGTVTRSSTREAYINHILSFIDVASLPPLKLVVNAGNGAAGPVLDDIEQKLHAAGAQVEFIKINHQPDPAFPNGIPNPLLVENRQVTHQAVVAHGADLGIAWDGDFDRCFLFDEKGQFVEGYYIVALLAEACLDKEPGARIIHDPRLTWNTVSVVRKRGGTAIQSRTGHAFIKDAMRQQDAAYGGEISAHHYFRDFAYCDSGMIPWLLVLEILAKKAKPLSQLIAQYAADYPVSGEINCWPKSPNEAVERVKHHYQPECIVFDTMDGIGMEFTNWRFNLRASNTEPVLRLNVESRGDRDLLNRKTIEILEMLG